MQTQTEQDDSNWLEAKAVFEGGPVHGGVPHEGTPAHYYSRGGQDLYDIFIEKYGTTVWLRHVEMECIQYLWRSSDKGTYVNDIMKVKVICERIVKELSKPGPTP